MAFVNTKSAFTVGYEEKSQRAVYKGFCQMHPASGAGARLAGHEVPQINFLQLIILRFVSTYYFVPMPFKARNALHQRELANFEQALVKLN